ncbi:MAG TPA: hypothetical protein ENJ19_01360 [Gammaproteobacteria bacterium]|nr:hypothetical protein [Gammaproteobacteria bacterium]
MKIQAEKIAALDERMERKPVLMPPDLIRKTERLAQEAKVSFAEIVRRALWDYDPGKQAENDSTLEALADALLQSIRETGDYLDKLEQKLDTTHRELEKHRHGAE